MPELEIGPALVGQKVFNPARPEWGVGTVLRVETTTVGGRPQHRVSIQFATGHRLVHVPPAQLTAPQPDMQRTAGWLDSLSGNTVDDRLCKLPAAGSDALRQPVQRLAALASLYTYVDEPSSLSKWARDQTGVGDPLSLWSRDELVAAFAKFCGERDAECRAAAAQLVHAEGPQALNAALGALPQPVAEAMRAALRRPI
jgi:hypothetical protein